MTINIFNIKVRIDFVITLKSNINIKFWIEYNGKQHYDSDSMSKIMKELDKNKGRISNSC